MGLVVFAFAYVSCEVEGADFAGCEGWDAGEGKTRDFYISVILWDLWLENSRVNVLLYDPSLCG
jgi:hypothetical protein